MYEMVKRINRYALIVALALLGALAGAASAQESEGPGQDIRNVLLTFHLIQADGFTDQDAEISDVVSELSKLFNFKGYRLLSTSVFNVGMLPNSAGTFVRGDGSQRIVPDDSETPLMIKANISARRSTGTVRATVVLTDDITRTRVINLSTRSTESLPLLEASVTMRDGQRVVLGSARRTAEEPVLILVVTPRIDP